MPKGNAVIYKPKEVSWEREVTLKKKKAFLKTRAKGRFFPPCETQCKQTKLWHFSQSSSGQTSSLPQQGQMPPAFSTSSLQKPPPVWEAPPPKPTNPPLCWYTKDLMGPATVQSGWRLREKSKFYLNSPSFPPSWVSLSLEVRLISAFGEHVKIVQLNGE